MSSCTRTPALQTPPSLLFPASLARTRAGTARCPARTRSKACNRRCLTCSCSPSRPTSSLPHRRPSSAMHGFMVSAGVIVREEKHYPPPPHPSPACHAQTGRLVTARVRIRRPYVQRLHRGSRTFRGHLGLLWGPQWCRALCGPVLSRVLSSLLTSLTARRAQSRGSVRRRRRAQHHRFLAHRR